MREAKGVVKATTSDMASPENEAKPMRSQVRKDKARLILVIGDAKHTIHIGHEGCNMTCGSSTKVENQRSSNR